MDTPSLIVMGILLLLYYQFFRRCQGDAKKELKKDKRKIRDKKKAVEMTAFFTTGFV